MWCPILVAPSHPFRTELRVGLLSVLNALLGIGKLWKTFREESHLGSAWVGAQLIDVLCAPHRDIYSELHTLTDTQHERICQSFRCLSTVFWLYDSVVSQRVILYNNYVVVVYVFFNHQYLNLFILCSSDF